MEIILLKILWLILVLKENARLMIIAEVAINRIIVNPVFMV
jgi:hypothetical protein